MDIIYDRSQAMEWCPFMNESVEEMLQNSLEIFFLNANLYMKISYTLYSSVFWKMDITLIIVAVEVELKILVILSSSSFAY